MPLRNNLKWPNDFPQAQSSSEFFSSKISCSYCYAKGGSHRFSSKTLLKDSTLETKEHEQRIPDLYISKEFNAILFSQYGVAASSGEIITSALPGWFNHKFESDYQTHYLKKFYAINKDDSIYCYERPSETETYYNTPSVLLGTPTDDAFSHFIFETLAKLCALDPKTIETYHFIVSDHIKPYQQLLLERAGISKDRQIKRSALGKHNVRLSEAILIKWPSHNNIWTAPSALYYLKELFEEKFRSEDQVFSRKNYLDRDDERGAYRRIENETELKKDLISLGFDIKTPGRLNFNQKRGLFRQSELIAGQYGGGLQLCFLAKHGTKLLIIQSEVFIRTHIDFMSSILGLETINVLAEISSEEKHSNAPIKISTPKVLETLNKLQLI